MRRIMKIMMKGKMKMMAIKVIWWIELATDSSTWFLLTSTSHPKQFSLNLEQLSIICSPSCHVHPIHCSHTLFTCSLEKTLDIATYAYSKEFCANTHIYQLNQLSKSFATSSMHLREEKPGSWSRRWSSSHVELRRQNERSALRRNLLLLLLLLLARDFRLFLKGEHQILDGQQQFSDQSWMANSIFQTKINCKF